MHAGHYNALRQAKALFSGFPDVKVSLVAGVHTDASIAQQKGPPVMNQAERVAMVEACKWVDEVAIIPDYLIDVALLDSLRCDFVAHGDDLPIRTDGTGAPHQHLLPCHSFSHTTLKSPCAAQGCITRQFAPTASA